MRQLATNASAACSARRFARSTAAAWAAWSRSDTLMAVTIAATMSTSTGTVTAASYGAGQAAGTWPVVAGLAWA